jgi:hypothetical protein
MSSPNADILRQIIIDNDLGSDNGTWPVFTGFLPDDSDAAICVYDTTGTKDGRIMRTGESIIHPGAQVRVRSGIYPDALKRIQEIAETLEAAFGITVDQPPDSYYIQNISRTGDLLYMGVELAGDRRRFNFTLNVILTVRKK